MDLNITPGGHSRDKVTRVTQLKLNVEFSVVVHGDLIILNDKFSGEDQVILVGELRTPAFFFINPPKSSLTSLFFVSGAVTNNAILVETRVKVKNRFGRGVEIDAKTTFKALEINTHNTNALVGFQDRNGRLQGINLKKKSSKRRLKQKK
ncbi:hypothetical protein L596_030592 [Steinernema carpocapsae]|uniref:Uncharacterized protein n=1 Tax=Steinernema carpocapsae TaxID=34508 RepID=A0A4U5LPW6_STECR|nr:hypothetical protein L596_030592 [Steinernema carpocapsae]